VRPRGAARPRREAAPRPRRARAGGGVGSPPARITSLCNPPYLTLTQPSGPNVPGLNPPLTLRKASKRNLSPFLHPQRVLSYPIRANTWAPADRGARQRGGRLRVGEGPQAAGRDGGGGLEGAWWEPGGGGGSARAGKQHQKQGLGLEWAGRPGESAGAPEGTCAPSFWGQGKRACAQQCMAMGVQAGGGPAARAVRRDSWWPSGGEPLGCVPCAPRGVCVSSTWPRRARGVSLGGAPQLHAAWGDGCYQGILGPLGAGRPPLATSIGHCPRGAARRRATDRRVEKDRQRGGCGEGRPQAGPHAAPSGSRAGAVGRQPRQVVAGQAG
jgi:hypothetical protein